MNVVHLLVDRLMRSRIQAAAAGHVQKFSTCALDLCDVIDYSCAILGRLEQNGSGAIAENDADGTIGVVGHSGILVRSDHQHFLVLSRFDELYPRVQRVNEARASRRDIESPGVLDAQLVLHQACGGGIHHVGRNRPHDDQVDFLQVERMRLQQVLHCQHGHVAGRDALVRNVALPNPDALENPLVAGVDHLLEIGIGKDARRQIGAKRANFGANRFAQCGLLIGETQYFERSGTECLTH